LKIPDLESPGKSLWSQKLKLMVLENPGKISLKVLHLQQAPGTEKCLNCFYNHCMYIETICG